MTLTEVRARIDDAIRGVVVSGQATHRDVLRHRRTPRRLAAARSRSYSVRLSRQPQRASRLTSGEHTVGYLVSIYYEATDDIDDRIGDDAGAVIRALDQLHGGDLLITDVRAAGVVPHAEGQLSSQFDVICTYLPEAP